jgi:hypothetical protein
VPNRTNFLEVIPVFSSKVRERDYLKKKIRAALNEEVPFLPQNYELPRKTNVL